MVTIGATSGQPGGIPLSASRPLRARILPSPSERKRPVRASAAARMNVTREEAQSRARMISVESYDVDLDLTEGDVTFGRRRPPGSAAPSRAPTTFIDLVADEVDEIQLNGRALDRAQAYDGTRITLDEPRPGQRADRPRAAATTCTPARGCTGSSTRSTSPSTSTPSSRSPTRAGCSPSSSSPTSRPPSRSRSPPPPTGRSSPTSRRRSRSRSGLGNATLAVRADRAHVVVHHGARRRARTTGSRASTATATGSSRWRCTAASRWRRTSTPT